MERESFENPEIAAVLHAEFVCIKVDREERPEIDNLYMSALQAMTREGGGWPLSVWLTPELHPYYAGTYFAPDNRYMPKRPAFPTILNALADAWKDQRENVVNRSREVTTHLGELLRAPTGEGVIDEELFEVARVGLQNRFDPVDGGFGRAPKFPHAVDLKLLMQIYRRNPDPQIAHMVTHTLEKMARGGIFDQLGGGFHRYSTDAKWLVPHFEKMLYDNAQLVGVYSEAAILFGREDFADVSSRILDWLTAEMVSPSGGFYSSQDADTDGEEGRYFVWTAAEIATIPDPEDARIFREVYGITEKGNFEGKTILCRARGDDAEIARLGLEEDDYFASIGRAENHLRTLRLARTHPGRDEKILAAWNGWTISGLAHPGMTIGDDFGDCAVSAGEFILSRMIDATGTLFRSCGEDSPAKIPGFLEDYAAVIDAFTHLYEIAGETRWLEAALKLADRMVADFADPSGPGFYFTAAGDDKLIVRARDTHDGSTPSGNSLAALALLRLSIFTGREDLHKIAEETVRSHAEIMRQSPGSFGQMLCAADVLLGPTTEIVVRGKAGATETAFDVLDPIGARSHARQFLIFHDPDSMPNADELVPLLVGKPMIDGQITMYVCENFACRAPLVGLGAIRKYLESTDPENR